MKEYRIFPKKKLLEKTALIYFDSNVYRAWGEGRTVFKTVGCSHQILAQTRKTVVEYLFLLIFTCIVVSQIAPMGAYSKVGTNLSESSSKVGLFVGGSLVEEGGLYRLYGRMMNEY